MKRSLFSFILMLSVVFATRAQDPHFSQYYANPMYLNPSLAGAGLCGGRMNLNYRNQWPGVPNAYSTFAASYDQAFRDNQGGFGLLFLNDVAGDGFLTTNHIGGSYAYRITLGRNWQLQAGIQGTYMERSIDFGRLRFGDQIDPNNGFVWPTQERLPGNNKISMFSVSSGLTLFSRTFFAGFAVHHMNQPNQSFFGTSGPGTFLPRKYTLHAGATLKPVTRPGQTAAWSISPNIMLQQQEQFSQLNLGFYFNKGPLITGLWFRQTQPNADAFVALVGFRFGDFQMGYSYDVTVSKAKAVTAGSHELSISYRFCLSNRPKVNWLDDVCPRL